MRELVGGVVFFGVAVVVPALLFAHTMQKMRRALGRRHGGERSPDEGATTLEVCAWCGVVLGLVLSVAGVVVHLWFGGLR